MTSNHSSIFFDVVKDRWDQINGDEIDCYITTGNDQPMRRLDAAGHPCHWILEVHLTDHDRGFGGFFEQLLDI